MNLIQQIQDAFIDYLERTFEVTPEVARQCTFELNVDEKKQQFGDLNSSAPLILGRHLRRDPLQVCEQITGGFKNEYIATIECAPPGFLNAILKPEVFQQLAQNLFISKNDFFVLDPKIPKHNYSIEFVSANPTGPLHIGHGRGGIIGDVLGNIIGFLGHKATKEFYINDAGSQIQKLGRSCKIRCQQEMGIDVAMPEDSYHGEYLIPIVKECIKEYGNTVLEKPDTFFSDYAKEKMLVYIKETLKEYGIHFDLWFSEKKELHDSNAIDHVIDILKKKGYIYEKDGALWFKSTAFGDDKDRVLRKSSGELTYVAADIAYLYNKVERGFDHLIMVLGHDHHSYAVRLESARQALNLEVPLDIILYQLVKMKEDDKLVRMSKRSGHFVTLRDIIEAVGTDVARFFYLNRKADAQLEFNLDLALKKTEENPVYYVQYAYVRTESILNKAQEEKQLHAINEVDVSALGPDESFLIKKIVSLKPLLETISTNYQTHLLTYYVIELANAFHRYYSKHRVIDPTNISQSRGRLLVIILLKDTFECCLKLLGISRPDKM